MSWVWYYMKNKKKDSQGSTKKAPTMFDVRTLLMQGKKDQAVKLYCQIFKTNATSALKEVEELERSLHK